MKLRNRSQWTFRFVLALGALIAVALSIQCVRTYLYIDSVLIPRQAEHEAQRQAIALGDAARNAGIDNPHALASSLQRAIESSAGRVLWMRVLDSDNAVLAQAGDAGIRAAIPAHWWERVQKHENRGTLIETSTGRVLSIMLPLRMPRRSHIYDRQGGYVLDLGISLGAVADTFAGLRKNLVLGMLASTALLVALMVIGLRTRSYLRGRYLESELRVARRVQNDLRPKTQSVSPYIEFAAFAIAADHVGGDFYDIFELETGEIAIVIGDVSGKGIPAALLVSLLQGAIRSSTASQHEFACERINRMLCERTANERFATLFWAVFNPITRTLRYVNAGHAAPMLLRRDMNRIERLSEGGPVLGCLPGARYSAAEIEIQDQDRLVLYTDGVSEAVNQSGEEFGDERVVEMLSKGQDLPPSSVCEQLRGEIAAFSGAEETLQDDRTLLVVRFLSNETIRKDYEPAATMAEVA